jgi:hypothetical protein
MNETQLDAAVLVDTAVRKRVLVALAGIHAKRYLRHPVFLVTAALVLSGVLQAIVSPDGDNGADWDATLTFVLWIGLFGVVVGYRITVTEDQALDVLPSAPTDQRVRTLALFAACLVPVGAVVVLMGCYGVVNLLVPQSADAPFLLRPDTGQIGWVDYIASVLEAPVSAFGGAALGIVVARWLRFAGAGVLAMVVVFLVEILCLAIGETSIVGDKLWARALANLMPYRYWFYNPDGADGTYYSTMAPGSAVGHVIYATALCGLAITAGVLKGAAPAVKTAWMKVGGTLMAVAVAAYLWALLG